MFGAALGLTRSPSKGLREGDKIPRRLNLTHTPSPKFLPGCPLHSRTSSFIDGTDPVLSLFQFKQGPPGGRDMLVSLPLPGTARGDSLSPGSMVTRLLGSGAGLCHFLSDLEEVA